MRSQKRSRTGHGARCTCHAHCQRGWLARCKMLVSTRQYYARETAAILTRTEPHGKRLCLTAVKQTRCLGLRHLRGNPRKMCPSVELIRQRSRMNNFNHQKRLSKGQLLRRLVQLRLKPRNRPINHAKLSISNYKIDK
jgi:hypothetical protein